MESTTKTTLNDQSQSAAATLNDELVCGADVYIVGRRTTSAFPRISVRGRRR